MVGVWAEFVTDEELSAALVSLQSHAPRLHWVLPQTRLLDDRYASLSREACDLGLEVFVWPVLEKTAGYWCGTENASRFVELATEVLAWRASPGGVAFHGISFDLEPHFERAESLRQTPLWRLDRWSAFLRDGPTVGQHQRAIRLLRRAVGQLQRKGLRCHATTLPVVLDQEPTNVALERALGLPVSGVDWDEISLMVYQTPFAELTGFWLGSALVESYASSAVSRFGSRAGLDLGIVGDDGLGVGPGNRYPDNRTLATDIAAACDAGISSNRIRIYGLRGLMNRGFSALSRKTVAAGTTENRTAVAGLRSLTRAIATLLARDAT